MSELSDESSSPRATPWAGYESLEEAIEGLRRARFRLERRYSVTGRGQVVDGVVADGRVAQGMVLLARTRQFANVVVELPIRAVEEVIGPGTRVATALVLGKVPTGPGEPSLDAGMVFDILERSPAA